MPDIQGQIKNVTSKTTNTGKVVYLVEFSDGVTYTTFKADVATEARNATGSTVVADVASAMKGQYTNHYWNGIKTVVAAAAGSTVTTPTASAPTAPATDKDAQIARAVAIKAAVDLVANGVPNPGLVTEIAAKLEPYLLGVKPVVVEEAPESAPTPW